MGYEFQITRVSFSEKDNQTIVEVALKNHGVAPSIMTGNRIGLFFNWRSACRTNQNELEPLWHPAKGREVWRTNITMSEDQLAVRVINPLPNGIPLTFANDSSLQLGNGWLLLPQK